jgi:AcrR family transcriptional regulator
MQAALRCAERSGVAGFSLEEVAAEAGVSRSSIYRHFPGGRSQLVEQTATWEVARFWASIAEAVERLDTLEDRLVEGLALGAEMIRLSPIMSDLVDPDLEVLAGAIQEAEPIVHAVIRGYMADLLERERAAGRTVAGLDAGDAADYLSRMVLSTMGAPAGVDWTDRTQARVVVRRQFLGGIVTGPA